MDLPPIGQYPVWVHVFCEALGMFVGMRIFLALKPKQMSDDHRLGVIAGCAVGAAIGTKLTVWMDHPAIFMINMTQPETLSAGKGIVGALLGGWLGIEVAKLLMQRPEKTGDYLAPGLLVGILIGRVGCFLCGLSDHTFGTPTTLPWAMDFGDGVWRHPTQFYEMIFLLLWGALLYWRQCFGYKPGQLFLWLMLGYLSFRFGVDFIKTTPHAYWGLNSTQVLCLIGLVPIAWQGAIGDLFLFNQNERMPA